MEAVINKMLVQADSLQCAVQCAELAEKLAADLVEEGLKGRTLTLKLKATNFEVCCMWSSAIYRGSLSCPVCRPCCTSAWQPVDA